MTTDITTIPQKERGIKRQKLRKWWLRLTLALAIFGPLLYVIAAMGTKLGLWSLKFGFGTLTRDLGPKVFLVTVIVAAIALILALVIKPRKGILIGVLGLLVPILGLGKLANVKKTAETLPFIHDVSTDTQNPPLFTQAILSERGQTSNASHYVGKTAPVRKLDGKGKPVTGADGKPVYDQKLVSVLQTKAYPEVRPLILEDMPDVVFGKAESIVKSMGWDIANSDVKTGIIEATETTFWYGFEDDVIIRIRPSEGGGTVVDIRSLSRVGGSDLGKNASRVKAFMAKLKAA